MRRDSSGHGRAKCRSSGGVKPQRGSANMADTITVTRQEIVNLYRVANNTAKQLEKLLLQFDLTDDSKERRETVRVYIPVR